MTVRNRQEKPTGYKAAFKFQRFDVTKTVSWSTLRGILWDRLGGSDTANRDTDSLDSQWMKSQTVYNDAQRTVTFKMNRADAGRPVTYRDLRATIDAMYSFHIHGGRREMPTTEILLSYKGRLVATATVTVAYQGHSNPYTPREQDLPKKRVSNGVAVANAAIMAYGP